ncbi:GntR family transcriptional regulator [Georgenia sp. TF02-10]|nr:GntR family transcriptional regulator [Georgenia sp. TF02-10]
MEPSSRVLTAAQVAAPAEVAAALERPAGAGVYYLHRVRVADGVPMALEENWVPADLVPGLLDAEHADGTFAALAQHGYPPSWGEDVIEAVTVRDRSAALLGVPDGAAGLLITRRTFSANVAVSYARSIYRGDRYALWAPVSPPSPAVAPPWRSGAGSGRPLPVHAKGGLS